MSTNDTKTEKTNAVPDNAKIGNSELKKAASVLQSLIRDRFLSVELTKSFNTDLVQQTEARFFISSPPKRGVNSQSVAIRFCPVTGYVLSDFDVTESGNGIVVTAKKA